MLFLVFFPSKNKFVDVTPSVDLYETTLEKGVEGAETFSFERDHSVQSATFHIKKIAENYLQSFVRA